MISLLRTTTRTMIFMALYLTLIGIICAVNQIYYQLKDPKLLGLILGPLNRTGIPIKSVLVFEVYRSAVDVWLLFYLSSIFQTSFFNFLFGLSQVTQPGNRTSARVNFGTRTSAKISKNFINFGTSH